MKDQIEFRSSLIEPIYPQTEPSQPIDLGQLAVEVHHKGKTSGGMASVRMSFVPDDRLQFIVALEKKDLLLFDCGDKLTLTDSGVTFEVLCVSAGDSGTVFLPKRTPLTVTAPSNAISKVTIHLFNFPDFLGSEDYTLRLGEPPAEGWKRCGRAVLRADGWEVTIADTETTDNISKALSAQGGYALTHMGQIAREDRSTFNSEQLEDLLTCLHYFLSFAVGRWAGVALPIGFDSAGKRVFEQWGMRMTAEGDWDACSWFDPRHGEFLSQVFPGFVALWKNPLWHEPLARAVYWYLGACDRGVGIGVDTGLVLAQTALELLAWTHCVQDRKMVSERAFEPRGLTAADKLRLLASSLGVPKEIPTALSSLHGAPLSGKKWVDGMEAVTSIRNSIVHPGKPGGYSGSQYYEACKLSLWYIDLTLLRLCGHFGNYANRLTVRWVGEIEAVPWATKK